MTMGLASEWRAILAIVIPTPGMRSSCRIACSLHRPQKLPQRPGDLDLLLQRDLGGKLQTEFAA